MDAIAPPKIDRPGSGEWTARRIEELTARWKNGESATMIAVAMHTSRNAVLGKTWRLGLRRAEIIPLRPRQRAAHRSPRRNGSAKPGGNGSAKPVEEAPPIFLKPKQFHELAGWDCRWPGDNGRFCAAPIVEGKPYCLTHCRMAYVRSYARISVPR